MTSLKIFDRLYREPTQRAIDLAHSYGRLTFHHDEGDIRPLTPTLAQMGLDILNHSIVDLPSRGDAARPSPMQERTNQPTLGLQGAGQGVGQLVLGLGVSGIPHFRPYDLRHLFVSKAIMSGVDTFTISKWTGHQSTRMIEQVYGHLTPEFRAKQMGRIDFGLGGSTAASHGAETPDAIDRM